MVMMVVIVVIVVMVVMVEGEGKMCMVREGKLVAHLFIAFLTQLDLAC